MTCHCRHGNLPFTSIPGTRQTPTSVPNPLVPLHCTIPGALLLPPQLFLCMLPHLRTRIVRLVPALFTLPRSCKGPSGTLRSQVQGSIYSTGTRFHLPDFSLISGSPGYKASTRSWGPVLRVTCHGNQDSPRLVPTRAVACRA